MAVAEGVTVSEYVCTIIPECLLPLNRVYKEELDIIMPYRAKDGRRIMICCVGKWNPSKASIHELLLTFYALLELIALEPKTQVIGVFN